MVYSVEWFTFLLDMGMNPKTMRLIDLHERSKLLWGSSSQIWQEVRQEFEREIATRIVREAQREREQWAKERSGWQPIVFA